MGNLVDTDKIIVVIKEIECWIIAGIKDSVFANCQKKIDISNTEIYDKEDFLPMMRHNPSAFYMRILKTYDEQRAFERNSSYKNFIDVIESIESGD